MASNGDASSLWDEPRQLGQLFMMGFDGTSINEQVRVLIEDYHVGSILLTAKNLKSAAQTTQLVSDLQKLAHDAGHPVPLLIAIDQENGGVNSLYDEIYIRQFPSAMGIAATGSKKLAKEVARATALELSSCGINWILGPVLDVLTNARNQPLGVRSIGDDPSQVSAYGIEFMKGYQEGGLATCGKHFPSYGNLEFFGAPTDVPTITDSIEKLSRNALVPFKSAIASKIDAMMVGGVAMATSGVNVMHACLSEEIVRNLLRQEMQFDGVVVSECLEMEALSRNIGISGGTVMAFQAGCDLILTCRSLSVQEEAINGLKAGLDNGMIERFRVQESVQRILALKSIYTSWEKAFLPQGIDNLTRLQPSHASLSTSAYNKSITVVRDGKKLLPLSNILKSEEELLLLTPLVKPLPTSSTSQSDQNTVETQNSTHHGSHSDYSVMAGEKVFRKFGQYLARKKKGKIFHTSYTANGVRPMHENLLNRSKVVIVVTADAGRNMYQQAFTKHISMLCKYGTISNGHPKEIPCIVVAVSSPFDFTTDLSIGTYVCTYDFTETALRALVRVLYDESTSVSEFGAVSNNKQPQSNHTRQRWLVEAFNEQRDSKALDDLLKQAQKEGTAHVAMLENTSSQNFLLRNSNIDEAHFVVRNSSTREIFGFCATYFYKVTGVGHIGAIIVDPSRRRLSVGHSLHDRAIRALLQRKGIKRFQVGVRLPNPYLGIPKSNPQEYKILRQWFAKLGWNVSKSISLASMIIRDLSVWTAPEGIGQALTNSDVKYDLVYGTDYAEAIFEHLKTSARLDLQDIYKLVMDHKEGSGIIRAKRANDGSILGSVLVFKSESKLAQFVPYVNMQSNKGCISSPAISKSARESNTVLQGLVLLGIRQLKRQGVKTVIMDCVLEDDDSIPNLEKLGFTILHRFDEVNSEPMHWTMMAPP